MKTQLKFLLMMFTAAFCGLPAASQAPLVFGKYQAQPPDSVDLAYYRKKDFAQASLTVLGLNTGIWAFDKFVRHADYADISFKTIARNFRKGFVWDNDRLGDNMFMHPYHGSILYNAARSNGFNYWQSGMFAVAGSALWELCMEKEYPSTNDIIATPIGGMAFGEVAYRASDVVLDDRSRGWARAGREIAAAIIDPSRGLTRLINGDCWRHRETSGRQFGTPEFSLQVSCGARMLEFMKGNRDTSMGIATELQAEYGDRFEVTSTSPYDYFSIRADLNFHSSQPLLGEVNVMGRLLSRGLVEKPRHLLSLGMYQHFEYYDSDTISDASKKTPYRLGIPASVGAGLQYRCNVSPSVVFDAYVHTNGIILGGVISDHYDIDRRDYNLASGFALKSGFNVSILKGSIFAEASNNYFRLFTWKGVPSNWQNMNEKLLNAQGDPSTCTFMISELNLNFRIWKQLFMTASLTHYYRSTHYQLHHNQKSSSLAARWMLTWKL